MEVVDQIPRTIVIDSIESTPKKTVLKQGKDKYYFWNTKQDGANTKANEQFITGRYGSGMAVQAMVEEQEKSFVNEKGKNITFMDRKILYFMGDKKPTQPLQKILNPTAPDPVVPSSADIETMAEKIADLEVRVETLEAFNGIINGEA